jgi:hypothetical protein
MSKAITGNVGPVLGIESSLDMYEKLKFESSRLQQGWHPYDAFNFLVTAHHLFQDWPQSDDSRALSRTKRQKKQLPVEMKLVLDVVRDLVNGSKHFNLDPSSVEKRRIDEVHTGEEVDSYEYYFHEGLPAVTVEVDWYFSIRVLNNLIMAYFEWTFNDSVPVKDFPSDLIEAILYCNIAQMHGGPSPTIWLQDIESAYRW